MATKLKRISEDAEQRVAELATREGRTFVSQLDRLVDTGLRQLGEPALESLAATKVPRAK